MNTTAVSVEGSGLEFAARRFIADLASRTIARVRARIAAARESREARALLLGMSERDLRDIGLTRFELHRFHHGSRF
jgi:uncharacterized protein YjiS (DUF1127 family)